MRNLTVLLATGALTGTLFLAGCQPPRPDIVKWYVTAYHERIYTAMCLFLDNQEVLDTMEIFEKNYSIPVAVFVIDYFNWAVMGNLTFNPR